MICPHCRNDVEGKWIDEGIGQYEYWGAKGNDVRNVFICEVCDGELEAEQSYEEYVQDMKDEHDYDRYEDRQYYKERGND